MTSPTLVDGLISSLNGQTAGEQLFSSLLFAESVTCTPVFKNSKRPENLCEMPADILQLHTHSATSPLIDIAQLVHDGLSHPAGQKSLPTILLYDERGLRLYDNITTGAPEYYLFGAEEQILKDHADDIVKVMHGAIGGTIADEVVLELGAGYVTAR